MTELKIAIRYIFSKHSFNFITIINFLSLIGIMIGVASLIVVLSIFNAFQDIAVKQIIGFDPHIKIENISSYPNFNTWKKRYLDNDKSIESQTTISESRLVCFREGVSRTANLNTVDINKISFFSNFESNLIIGTINFYGNDIIPKVFIGAGLADALHTLTGDTLYLTTASEIENSILSSTFPKTEKAVVTGIFQTNVKDYDYNYIFGTFGLSNALLKDNFNKSLVYSIRLKDINKLDAVYNQIKLELPNNKLQLTNWKNMNRAYYNVMKFEKMSTTFILGLIILVAIFNVFASLTMTIIEKKKDISVLRAIGASQKFIQRIYLNEGLFVGFIGSVFGGILGLLLCWGQINFKWFKIDNTKYIMDSIPILVKYSDVFAIVILSFVLSILATFYPARKSAKIDIVESLREE